MAVQLEFSNRPKLLQTLNDSLIMIRRSSRHIFRNKDQLLGAFFQPIMFLLLFSAVFGGAISLALPDGVDYLDYLMAGIIVQTVAFGSTTTAVAVCNDLQKGIVDRFKSLPMYEGALVTGHVVSDLLRNGISTAVMLLAGLVIGFRSSASFAEWLLIIFVLLLFTFAFSWLSAIVGLIAKSVEGVQWIAFVMVFPLTFASTAFVPAEGMPNALKFFAENQPITQVIEAVRALMLGNPAAEYVQNSIIWSILILAITIPIATIMFKRKTTN